MIANRLIKVEARSAKDVCRDIELGDDTPSYAVRAAPSGAGAGGVSDGSGDGAPDDGASTIVEDRT